MNAPIVYVGSGDLSQYCIKLADHIRSTGETSAIAQVGDHTYEIRLHGDDDFSVNSIEIWG
jgi:phage replication-related protein YjqB (UPF0714/DUF867 family)